MQAVAGTEHDSPTDYESQPSIAPVQQQEQQQQQPVVYQRGLTADGADYTNPISAAVANQPPPQSLTASQQVPDTFKQQKQENQVHHTQRCATAVQANLGASEGHHHVSHAPSHKHNMPGLNLCDAGKHSSRFGRPALYALCRQCLMLSTMLGAEQKNKPVLKEPGHCHCMQAYPGATYCPAHSWNQAEPAQHCPWFTRRERSCHGAQGSSRMPGGTAAPTSIPQHASTSSTTINST